MLSPVGKVMSYPPLRTLVIEDRSDVIERVALVIADLDKPPRQVLIEAQIIEARLSNDLRFGIDWSLVFSSGNGAGNVIASGFGAPAAAGSKGLFVSWAEGDFMARLEALEGVDEVHTVASPRLLAVDGSEAEIIIGGQLGYTVVTTYDRAVMESVEFLDTGAQLRIRPTITGDGKVLMNIHPELSDGVIEQGLPAKTTAQVTTDVLVEDGQTLLIGGLIQTREEVNRKGIPILMNIPLIGGLFGQTIRSEKRSELITLITPTIVKSGESPPYRGIGLLSSDDLEPWSGKEDVE
jgi:type II secretory pathway component GspD/PulD (secretin)